MKNLLFCVIALVTVGCSQYGPSIIRNDFEITKIANHIQTGDIITRLTDHPVSLGIAMCTLGPFSHGGICYRNPINQKIYVYSVYNNLKTNVYSTHRHLDSSINPVQFQQIGRAHV